MTSEQVGGETQGYKRKLIEVALPLEDINKEAAREKSIRHGHPSTLHLWWARRPLAAARAVLFGQLVDDPSAHPDRYPTPELQNKRRDELFDIIRDLVKWDNSNDETVLRRAREEIWESCDGNPPPILDPFAGGGTIPLEAQRLGLEAHASDLNPVAVLINKALIEIPPKWADQPPVFPGAASKRQFWTGAQGVAEDVRQYGKWIRDEAEKRIGHLYPKAKLPDGSEATVIAWIWTRTVTCPNPACQGTMPLVRSFLLSKKEGRKRYVEPIPDGDRVNFEIRGPEGEPREGTVGRKGAVCLICETPVSLDHIRAEGKAGRMGAQLMAIAAEGRQRREYLPPDEKHEAAAKVPRPADAPLTELPLNTRDFKTPNYGMFSHADIFTNRQLTALTTLCELSGAVRDRVERDAQLSGRDPKSYADAIITYLALAIDKTVDRNTTICAWEPAMDRLRGTFQRQALPMTWDYAEANQFGDAGGDFKHCLRSLQEVLDRLPSSLAQQHAYQDDARSTDSSARVVSTDPPYYDNVGYADLSDFFYVWLRRCLREVHPELFSTMLTPKTQELVADPFRHSNKQDSEEFFRNGFEKTFEAIARSTQTDFPITVFYAFKQVESATNGDAASTGWETLLEGMIRAGWTVTATWPMRTELGSRMMSFEKNALASSVVLACRVRKPGAGTISRRGFQAALHDELPDALRELQQGNIAPVDLAQAAIGPGMAVFSRYERVTEPDGAAMKVRTALGIINQVLDQVLAEQEGDFDPETRWCVKWFEQHAWDQGQYGTAETLAKATNTAVGGLEDAGVLKARAGKVQLLAPEDLRSDYDPEQDARPTAWEAMLYLSKWLEDEKEGLDTAGAFLAKVKSSSIDADAVQKLTYRLYNICERRKWPQAALRFNNLVASWPDLAAVAQQVARAQTVTEQGTFDLGAAP